MVVVFTITDRGTLLNCLIEVYLAKIFDKFSKFKLFSSKMEQNMILWSTSLKLARLSDLEIFKRTL